MAKQADNSGQVATALVAAFTKLPPKAKIALVVAVLVVGGVAWAAGAFRTSPPSPTTADGKTNDPPPADAGDAPSESSDTHPLVNLPPPPAAFPAQSRPVVFCFWNVENLFDDVHDKRRSVDEKFDTWFVNDPAARQKKYDHLAEILLKMNDGKGPDILACAEVESPRAAEMLKDTLNAALPAGADKYGYVAMKPVDAGRHIAPCVISRIPIDPRYTRLVGSKQRILQVWLNANGHDLLLIASHWTSQLSDKGDDEHKGRAKYADAIHALYAAELKKNPKLDFVVCGDFNDSPEADAVRNKLHMTGDSKLVTADGDPPRLFGLLSGKKASEFGTISYQNKPLIYDHIGVSPGMFDSSGWGYDPNSVKVHTEGMTRGGVRRPWRFGSATDTAAGRGYSDHFPVVVTLRVSP